ncbi:hypothetical protein LB506_007360 [Fusarium annulatum]|nr:hypothetical protein LB506_007360 [Fusarium annulatum]
MRKRGRQDRQSCLASSIRDPCCPLPVLSTYSTLPDSALVLSCLALWAASGVCTVMDSKQPRSNVHDRNHNSLDGCVATLSYCTNGADAMLDLP